MTDHEANRKICLARGIQDSLEQLIVARGEAEGNSQLFPGPTESREQDRFFVGQGISYYLFYYIIICLL